MSTVLGIDSDLFISEAGLIITAVAAVIGIWIDRDEERPLRYSVWLTVLVILATAVGAFQGYTDFLEQEKLKGDIARILQKVDKIANQGKADVPALNETLKTEVAAQARGNPDVVAAMAQRVVDEGGDPKAVFGSYLTDVDMQGLAADGKLATAPIDTKLAAMSEKPATSGRHPITFGAGKAQLRPADKTPSQAKPEKKP